MKKEMQLVRLAIFCAVLASCAQGLKATVCIVDAGNQGFQCVYDGQQGGFLMPFDKGTDLLCASPGETEDFLKACKNHEVLAITLCSYGDESFLCKDPLQHVYKITPIEADNFFCLSPKDRKRLLERCK